MFSIDWYSLFYDVIAYIVAFRSLIDEILYKLNFKRHLDFRKDLPVDLSNHVAVVTGGTRGLGLTVVRALISKGCYVFVASSQIRDKFVKIEEKIYEGIPEKDPETGVKRGTVNLQYLDLSSLSSVKKFIDSIKGKKQGLNYLVCNAGIMFAPRQMTIDNLESHFAVNYVGHALIILDLLQDLRKGAELTGTNSRIISVSSSTHRITKFKFDDVHGEINYSPSQAYGQSKLAQIMFTVKLSELVKNTLGWNNVQCFSLHPAVVLSDLYEHVNIIRWFPFLIPIIKLLTRDTIDGAETTIYATLSQELDGLSGQYLEDCAIKEPSLASQNREAQDRLWDLTLSILRKWTSTDFEGKKTR